MAIRRIYLTKDNTITNYMVNTDWRATGSNAGRSEILHLFKEVNEQSGSLPSWSRILVYASSSYYSNSYTSGTYTLVMKHAPAAEPLPSNFDVYVYPVETEWDEGTGLDDEDWLDKGQSNWEYKKASSAWTITGSDYNNSISGAQHFSTGEEDLSVDITNIAIQWKSGSLVNEGLLVKYIDAQENDDNDYYTKKFFARHSHFLDKRPYIELKYCDHIVDNRGDFLFDKTGSLVLYYNERGIAQEIPDIGALSVRIVSSNGNYNQDVGDASYIGNGMYQIWFSVPYSSAYSSSGFYDIWTTGSTAFKTGAFSITQQPYDSSPLGNTIYIKSDHLPVYKFGDLDKVRVKIYRPNIYATSVASASYADSSWLYRCPKAYYSIYDIHQQKEIISKSDYTQLSYDYSGNYFYFDFSCLVTGSIYEFRYYINDGVGTREISSNKNFKFKVE